MVFDGVVDGGLLTLGDTFRSVAVHPEDNEDNDEKLNFMMTVSGTGEKFENVILFNMIYKGNYNYDGLEGKVTRSAVNCISRENE